MTADPRLAGWRTRADAVLAQALPLADLPPRRLHAAMRHAVLLGGKRMRPLLVYAAGTLAGADEGRLDAPAAAVELVHAYSLVHDDLPSMDDDALRRGQPTVHVAFDEATAVLAGDALQSLAFQVLARAGTPPVITVAMLDTLADAAGVAGMCGGQALDIDATGRNRGQRPRSDAGPDETEDASANAQPDPGVSLAHLERLHALKTGALIRAAVRMGGLCGGLDATALARLDGFASALGLAFQVRDDILDVEGDSATLGKTPGKDAAQDKATFPALIGMDASRARLAGLVAEMDDALAPFDDAAAPLRALGRLAVERDR